MKKTIKSLSIIFFILIAISCNQNNENIIPQKEKLIDTNSKKQIIEFSRTTNDCGSVLIDNPFSPIQIGQTRTWTVNDFSSFYQWSVLSGSGIQIIGDSNLKSFRLKFSQGFTTGVIRVLFNNCEVSITIVRGGYNIICSTITTTPTPSPVYSDFGSPVPSNYIKDNLGQNYICTKTINNTLSVPYEPCTNYSWSISPAGTQGKIFPSLNNAIVTVSQVGTYTVTLTTTNSVGTRIEQFKLYAQDCNTVGGGLGF